MSAATEFTLPPVRTFPSENCHWDVVGTYQIPLHLLLQVVERIELQIVVKPFLIVPVTAFHLAVMPRRSRTDQLVRDVVFVAEYVQRMYAVRLG